MAKRKSGAKVGAPEIRNPRVRYSYEILERFECGVILVGPEVKSLREGQGSIDEAYARLKGNELWLIGMHIPEYRAKGYTKHDPVRPRKLLLHRREILNIRKSVERQGLTLVPLRLYWNERNLAKVEIALARGKKLHDRRNDARTRDAKREIDRALRRRS